MLSTGVAADQAGFLRSNIIEVENDALGPIAPFGVARHFTQDSGGVFREGVVGQRLVAGCRGLRRFRSIHDASEHGFLAYFCPRHAEGGVNAAIDRRDIGKPDVNGEND